MANNCMVDLKIAGREEDVLSFVALCKGEGKESFGRIFSFYVDASSLERDPKDPSYISVQAFGDVAWSIKSAMLFAKPFGLEDICEKMDLVVEGYSSEPGCQFQEHILCDKGNLEINDCVDYEEYWLEEMTEEDIAELAWTEHLTVDEVWKTASQDDNCFKTGGFGDDYGCFSDLFGYFEAEIMQADRKPSLELLCKDAENRRTELSPGSPGSHTELGL